MLGQGGLEAGNVATLEQLSPGTLNSDVKWGGVGWSAQSVARYSQVAEVQPRQPSHR